MPFPTLVTFKDMDSSPALEARIVELADKLERLHDGILKCEVLVEQPHRHHRHGRHFHVRVNVQLAAPGGEIVVSRDPGDDDAHDDAYVAVRDAFVTAKRQLQTWVDKVRGDVKTHDAESLARDAQAPCGAPRP